MYGVPGRDIEVIWLVIISHKNLKISGGDVGFVYLASIDRRKKCPGKQYECLCLKLFYCLSCEQVYTSS